MANLGKDFTKNPSSEIVPDPPQNMSRTISNQTRFSELDSQLKYGQPSWAPPRTQSTPEWKNFPWPGGDLSYPDLPLFQNAGGAYTGGRTKEYTFRPGRLSVDKLFDPEKCLKPPSYLKPATPTTNIKANYQILETIPCSIIKGKNNSVNTTESSDSMTLPDVISIDAKSNCPYQTHAWLYEKFEKAKYSISFCCMYFTFNAENCPYCNCDINSPDTCTPEDCNLKPEVKERVQQLVAQLQKVGASSTDEIDGRVLCGNCVNAERYGGCCNPDTGFPPGAGLTALGIKNDPKTGTPADGICDRDNIRGKPGEAPRYHPNGYAIWDSLVRAVTRGVKLKIIFAWPCMVDSALSLKSMLYLKSLNPSGVQLFPLNVTSFFRNDPTPLYVTGENQEKIPIFTASDVSSDTPYGGYWNCPNNAKPEFAGDVDLSFAPTGFPPTGSGILHSKIYTIDHEDDANCAMYTGAQNATYDGSLELGIGVSSCPELVNDAQRILDIYALSSCIQNPNVAKDIMQPQARGTIAEMIQNWNTKYKDWNQVLTLGANSQKPYKIMLNPEPRPNGLDGRISFNTDGVSDNCNTKKLQKSSTCSQSVFTKVGPVPTKCPGFEADVYLTNCPKIYCDLTDATFDLQGILNLVNSAKKFVCINVMDWGEITTYLTCTDATCSNPEMEVHGTIDMQSPWPNNKVSCVEGKWPKYKPPITGLPNIQENQGILTGENNRKGIDSIVGLRGPQARFTVFAETLMAAALRGVTVKILVGQRGKQPCGDDPDKFISLMTRNAQINKIIKEKGGTGSMEAKYFVYLCDANKKPSQCYGAFHQKFVVTDEGVAISSSNYVADYFATTHGVSFMQKTESMAYNPLRDDLLAIFKRNFAVSLKVESIVCKCASQGWPGSGTPLPGATPHYFCQTPDCGIKILNTYGKCDPTCPSSAQDWPRLADGSLDPSVKCGDFTFNDQINIKDLPDLPISEPPPYISNNTIFTILIALSVVVLVAGGFFSYRTKNLSTRRTILVVSMTISVGLLVAGIAVSRNIGISSLIFCITCVLILGATSLLLVSPKSGAVVVPTGGSRRRTRSKKNRKVLWMIIGGLIAIASITMIIMTLTKTVYIGPGKPSPPLPPIPQTPSVTEPGVYKPRDPIKQKTTNGDEQKPVSNLFPPAMKSVSLFNSSGPTHRQKDEPKYWNESQKRYDLTGGKVIAGTIIKTPNKTTWMKDCLSNYFKILYPAVNSLWFDSLDENLLAYLYNKLDWYYTPLVFHPQQPSRSRQELTDISSFKDNDRQRPILSAYYDAYVPNFSMGVAEVVIGPGTSAGPGKPTGPVTGNNAGATAGVGWPWPLGNNNSYGKGPQGQGLGYQWPKMPTGPGAKSTIVPDAESWQQSGNNWVARPTMEVHFLAPWGRPRHGYPSYSYLESVSGGQELGGVRERGATGGGCGGMNLTDSRISSFNGSDDMYDNNFVDFASYVATPPVVHPNDAGESPAYQGISGYFSKMDGSQVTKPGLPTIKEEFRIPGQVDPDHPDGCNGCSRTNRMTAPGPSPSPGPSPAPSPGPAPGPTCPADLLCGDSGCVQSVKDYRAQNPNWCEKSFYNPKQTPENLPKDNGNPNQCGSSAQPCSFGWGAKHGTCLYGHSGFIGNPWLLYKTVSKKGDGINPEDNDWLLPGQIKDTNSYGYLKDPMTILDAGTGLPYRASNPSGEPRAYVLDPKTGKPRRAAEIGYFPDSPDAFCATSDASDSCRIPQELFYPEKGYGKFINIGRTGVFFNNWHVLLTLHDRNGEGKQFRWVMEQFMALNTEQSASDRPNGVNSMIVARSGGNDPITGSSATDNREYLSGFYTFPKNGVFGMNLEPVTSTNINQWVQDADKKTYTKKVVSGYDSSAGKIVDYPTVDSFSIDQTKGIPIKCSDPGGIVGVFVPGKPQVEWSGNSSEGAGQLFWQRGMDYKMPDGTSQFLSCENPWMNPMDDGELGRLTYIGKNFVQYYIPPELGLKNPYFQKKISDFYPGGKYSSVDINDTNAVTTAYEQMGRDLGMPSDATQEMIREEFALRWVEASLIYGDNGQHSEIKSWPWGTQATATSSDGSCVYKAIGAMGWNTVVVTMKPCRFGQPQICETPYYDSELIYIPCSANYKPSSANPMCDKHCVNGISTWAGALGVDSNVFKQSSCPISKILGKESLKEVTLCIEDNGKMNPIYQDSVGVCGAPYHGGAGYYQNSWSEKDVCTTKPKDLKASGFSGIWTNSGETDTSDPFELYLRSGKNKQSAHTQTCKYMRYVDISQCLDLYLKWGFVPAFNDRSTPSTVGLDDCDPKNKNHIYWNVTPLNREFGAMSEISSDIPAQGVRQYFAPPKEKRTNMCTQCPEMAVAYVPEEQFKGKNYLLATEPYRGIPFVSASMGEGLATWCGDQNPRSNNFTPATITKLKVIAKSDSDGIAPVYQNNTGFGNGCVNIQTAWGRRGAFGSYDYIIPSEGNEYMNVEEEVSTKSTDYLACQEVESVMDSS